MAPTKTTITANTKKLAMRLAKAMGKEAKAHSANTLLGCDIVQGGAWKHQVHKRTKGRPPVGLP